MSPAILSILAQQSAQKGNPPSAMPMLIGLAFFFGLFYFVLTRSNRKQQRERKLGVQTCCPDYQHANPVNAKFCGQCGKAIR